MRSVLPDRLPGRGVALHETVVAGIARADCVVADVTGQSAKYKGFAEQCMAEYDLNGWTAEDLINPDDINLFMKKKE